MHIKYTYPSNPADTIHDHSLNSGFSPILKTNMILFIEVSPIRASHTTVLLKVEQVSITLATYALICWLIVKWFLWGTKSLIAWLFYILSNLLKITVKVNVLCSFQVSLILLTLKWVNTLTDLLVEVETLVALSAFVLVEVPEVW